MIGKELEEDEARIVRLVHLRDTIVEESERFEKVVCQQLSVVNDDDVFSDDDVVVVGRPSRDEDIELTGVTTERGGDKTELTATVVVNGSAGGGGGGGLGPRCGDEMAGSKF